MAFLKMSNSTGLKLLQKYINLYLWRWILPCMSLFNHEHHILLFGFLWPINLCLIAGYMARF